MYDIDVKTEIGRLDDIFSILARNEWKVKGVTSPYLPLYLSIAQINYRNSAGIWPNLLAWEKTKLFGILFHLQSKTHTQLYN